MAEKDDLHFSSKEQLLRYCYSLFLRNGKYISRDVLRRAGVTDKWFRRFYGDYGPFRKALDEYINEHTDDKSLIKPVFRKNLNIHIRSDLFDAYNRSRLAYADRYVRSTNKRFVTMVSFSDVHDIKVDPFWRRVLMSSLSSMDVDIIVINGDLFDLPEFSKYHTDPREWDAVGRIKFVHNFLEELREVAPDSQIDLIEGNHEVRLLRYLAEAAAPVSSILADLHGMGVPDLLGLDKFEINYIGRADLRAHNAALITKEVYRNWRVYNNCVLATHYPDMKKFRMPGFGGHHHKHICYSFFSPVYGTCEFHQLGAGCKRQATFTNGEEWSNGFLITIIDTEKCIPVFQYVDVSDHALVNGELFVREEGER